MMGLTKRQSEALDVICAYTVRHRIPPSLADIQSHLGLRGNGGVHRLVQALFERGVIRRLPNRARAMEIVHWPEKYLASRPKGMVRGPDVVSDGQRYMVFKWEDAA
jgi:repressor LexA